MDPWKIRTNSLNYDGFHAGDRKNDMVLLLHGFPQSAYEWRLLLPRLAEKGYYAVAPNGRGTSACLRPDKQSEYAMDKLLGDVTAIADYQGAETFHLVGHDWGGAVAWQFAARFPDRLKTLSILSTPHPVAFNNALHDKSCDQSEKSRYMEWFRGDTIEDELLSDDAGGLQNFLSMAGISEDDIPVYFDIFKERAALTGSLNWYREADPADGHLQSAITVPTLYIYGTEDLALGIEAARASAEFCKGYYEYVEIDGAGHWLPEQSAEEVNQHVLKHLSA